MKNKVLAVLLAMAMAVGLAACGESGGDAPAPGTGTEKESGGETADNGETYNIVMQIVTFGQEFTGIPEVEAAINEIVEPEIGVTVTLAPVAAWDLPTTSALEITSKNKLDLMLVLPMGSGLDSLSNYTSKNMIQPLDELVAEFGQDITDCVGPLMEVGYNAGALYGIPANYLMGSGYAYVVRTDIMNELGFSFDSDKVYSMSDLEPMFAAYKEAYGDGYYAIASFNEQNLFMGSVEMDNFGDFANGAIVGDITGTEIVNPYETQEFSDYLHMARDWYTKGYLNPDCTTISDAWPTLISGGNYLGAFTAMPGDGLDALPSNQTSAGYELTMIKLVDDYATTGVAQYGLWSIPNTCQNPEKVMQFLNILYQDRELSKDVDTLIANGIEGTSYVITEEVEGSRNIVDYPEGVDPMTTPYTGTVPVYGNCFTQPKMAPLTSDIYERLEAYNQSIEDAGRISSAFGYSFDSTAVSSQKSAVQNVIKEYESILTHGSVDPDEVLPQFLDALESAGYSEVIAANQEQFDEWRANK